ncbi:MAG: T9SS type A sorting domain-containing protein [bacterium]
MVLEFDRVIASHQIYFEGVADLKPPPPPQEESIVLQIESEGSWTDIDVLPPRANWSTELVDLSPYLESVVYDLRLRLFWTSHHKLDYVGLARPEPVPTVERECQLVSAVHSEVGSVTDRLISADENYAELIPGEEIELSFSLSAQIPGVKRDFVLITIGHCVTESPGGSSKMLGDGQHPSSFWHTQNYPNPFNPETEISYGLSEPSHVRLAVFNLIGQKVRTLVDEPKESGYYTVIWNGGDEFGGDVASGVYFCRLQAGEFTSLRKMLLLK